MSPTLLHFAPGGNVGPSSAWMRHWSRLLARFGDIETFAWFDAAVRPPFDRLVDFHLEQLQRCRARYERVILVGKSLGAWTSCGVAARTDVDAVVCLGYPLTEPNETEPLRAKPLVELTVPGLVVYGTEDPLCPREVLEEIIFPNPQLTACPVPRGDHSLVVQGSAGARVEAERDVCNAVEEFLHSEVIARRL